MKFDTLKPQLSVLVETYHYREARRLLELVEDKIPEDFATVLQLLAERRELKLDLVFDDGLYAHIQESFGFSTRENNDQGAEQLSNYLADLEAKSKTGDIIDFCRAVSPLFYRILERLIMDRVPDLKTYIKNGKGTAYDKWRLDRLSTSADLNVQAFFQLNKRQPMVTSDSFVDFLSVLDYEDTIKEDAKLLREFERSIRNPLAHLIKPFNEQILAQDTHFSSQDFLNRLIKLLHRSGIRYQRDPFYFDAANQKVLDHFLKN